MYREKGKQKMNTTFIVPSITSVRNLQLPFAFAKFKIRVE